MKRFETPKIELLCNPDLLTDCADVVVTFIADTWERHYKLTEGGLTIDADNGAIILQLEQEDTLEAPENCYARGQVSIKYSDGKRIVSDPFTLPIQWTAYDAII